MKKIVWIFFVLIIITVTACETIIKVDLPDYNPKLVIGGFFSPDTSWQITVSHSNSILDINEPEKIDNAIVKILSGTEEVLLRYRYDLGIYLNRLKRPEVGKDYIVHVYVPGYEEVTARNSIPRPSQIISYDKNQYVDSEFGINRNLVELTFTLKDDPEQENYYHLAVYEYNSPLNYFNISFSTDNASIVSENKGDGDAVSFAGEDAVFSDFLFKGQEYKIKLREISESNNRIFIALTTISEEFFLYKKSFDLFANNDDGPFSEPEPSYTNIENGLGIFAGFNTTLLEVK